MVHTLENSSVSVKRELGSIYMKRVLESEDIAKMIEILNRTDARQASQAKAQELVDQALTELQGAAGVSEEEMDALASLGRWAAAGGR